ncbi:MAG: hypothetical protein M0C28_04605 [Candidatus Moduliflexus flocculans]|nr:hypothetical protein [Candidatus Moduliflexus flocculans]
MDDGRYRIYYAVADTPGDPDWWGMVSWISDDGLNFTKEAGYRFEGYTLFGHWIVRNPDASFRMYWLDQKQGPGQSNGLQGHQERPVDGRRLERSRQSPASGMTYSGSGYETNGIGSGKGASSCASGQIPDVLRGVRAITAGS